jgi:hypothetical protein
MHRNHERTGIVTVHRGVPERPLNVRHTTSAAAAGRSVGRMVSREHPLHDQVRTLRIALSDLTIQVSDLAARFERE